MNYITPTGSYYEGDRVSINDVACAARPEGQVFTGTVSLDPSIMWRPKTQAELDADVLAGAASQFYGIYHYL